MYYLRKYVLDWVQNMAISTYYQYINHAYKCGSEKVEKPSYVRHNFCSVFYVL